MSVCNCKSSHDVFNGVCGRCLMPLYGTSHNENGTMISGPKTRTVVNMARGIGKTHYVKEQLKRMANEAHNRRQDIDFDLMKELSPLTVAKLQLEKKELEKQIKQLCKQIGKE
jgi:hypothetical protein